MIRIFEKYYFPEQKYQEKQQKERQVKISNNAGLLILFWLNEIQQIHSD